MLTGCALCTPILGQFRAWVGFFSADCDADPFYTAELKDAKATRGWLGHVLTTIATHQAKGQGTREEKKSLVETRDTLASGGSTGHPCPLPT
eukprot:scaffold35535_cov101-Isochrysis_galbana.AAC.1